MQRAFLFSVSKDDVRKSKVYFFAKVRVWSSGTWSGFLRCEFKWKWRERKGKWKRKFQALWPTSNQNSSQMASNTVSTYYQKPTKLIIVSSLAMPHHRSRKPYRFASNSGETRLLQHSYQSHSNWVTRHEVEFLRKLKLIQMGKSWCNVLCKLTIRYCRINLEKVR